MADIGAIQAGDAAARGAGGGAGVLYDTFAAIVELTGYDEIREALMSPDLSRTFDTRGYDEGNIRDGIVSIQHGAVQRARRRVENTQFRPDILRLYETSLFPAVLNDLLDLLLVGDVIDLYRVGEMLASVLACRRAGLDIRERDLEELAVIVDFVDIFSQGAAILDAKDPEEIRTRVYDAYVRFERDYVGPARARRQALLDDHARGQIGEDALPHDILTALLRHRADPSLELADDGRLVREVATYLQGGTHTNGQTVVNAIDLLFQAAADDPTIVDRVAEDRLFSQRVVHESLRLRPTTPRIRRRAITDTTIGGRSIAAESLVILDIVRGNQDPAYFGNDRERFDPDRTVDPTVPRWGLSFGAGAHICPGRTVAGGFPVPPEGADDEHLFGLVAAMLQELLRRGIEPVAGRAPERDTRTERFTRWAHYWVRVGSPRAVSPVR
ncbi:MAG TPA: cytochrome P450 [Candidatus Limnocylindrales bacterium]|nr:cytochrome P450 [Candidatus Limnocylindrales bacterium]